MGTSPQKEWGVLGRGGRWPEWAGRGSVVATHPPHPVPGARGGGLPWEQVDVAAPQPERARNSTCTAAGAREAYPGRCPSIASRGASVRGVRRHCCPRRFPRAPPSTVPPGPPTMQAQGPRTAVQLSAVALGLAWRAACWVCFPFRLPWPTCPPAQTHLLCCPLTPSCAQHFGRPSCPAPPRAGRRHASKTSGPGCRLRLCGAPGVGDPRTQPCPWGPTA